MDYSNLASGKVNAMYDVLHITPSISINLGIIVLILVVLIAINTVTTKTSEREKNNMLVGLLPIGYMFGVIVIGICTGVYLISYATTTGTSTSLSTVSQKVQILQNPVTDITKCDFAVNGTIVDVKKMYTQNT